MIETRHYNFWEHFNLGVKHSDLTTLEWETIIDKKFKHGDRYCFRKNYSNGSYNLNTEYFIGLDWLLEDKVSIYVAPKLNTRVLPNFDKDELYDNFNTAEASDEKSQTLELDYLSMLNDCICHEEVLEVVDKLLIIDWDAKEISIERNEDLLSPFLIVQFLNLLKKIVRKGLKKSYYTVEENLSNRVKGKISVSRNIKLNVLKGNRTNTICLYQEFGVNSAENQFLKQVLLFCFNYVNNHKKIFNETYEVMSHIISFCNPAFENVSSIIEQGNLKSIKHNVFFKEYEQCIKIGKQILKRFGYNITLTTNLKLKTPPFWIDMPKLFELYVYGKLLNHLGNKNDVKFQFSTYGNALDFLVTKTGYKMVVDAKYKLAYSDRHMHQDIRQVSGYARLKVVYEELSISEDKIIDCLIIYPNMNLGTYEINLDNKSEIQVYKNVYKLGLTLPIITEKRKFS